MSTGMASASDALASASLSHRSNHDLIRNTTQLQSVPWSPAPRWVTSPRNVGHATAQGIELEMKCRADQLWNAAPSIDLRANYSLYTSHVDGIPGPDNRLDQQPRRTANLGADYRLRRIPLTLGGNVNWTPAFAVRQSQTQQYWQGIKRVVDVYALWKFDANTQLRLSATNLSNRDFETANQFATAASDYTSDTRTWTYTSWSARLELKF